MRSVDSFLRSAGFGGALAALGTVLVLAACKPRPEDASDAKIAGGHEATNPAVVFLKGSRTLCTGTFIGRRQLLTAWHCIGDLTTGGIVFAGEPSIAVALPIRQFYPRPVTPAVIAANARYDIALVTFARGIAPAVMPIGANPGPGASVELVGFGMTGIGLENNATAGKLRSGTATVAAAHAIDYDGDGREDFSDDGLIVTEGGAFLTSGDSGGALLFDGRLIGVSSVGPDKGEREQSLFVDLGGEAAQAVLRDFIAE